MVGHTSTVLGRLVDAGLDLLAGSRCVGCGRPGRPWCPRCETDLRILPRLSWPTPSPPGLVPPVASGEYADGLRALVVAFKEERVRSLEAPLARRLSASVAALGLPGPLVLVPVPSRASSVRARGLDSTAVLARRAARLLRRDGAVVLAWPGLRLRRGVRDQAGLDAAARTANLAGSMAVDPRAQRRLARRCGTAVLVICDDVITTGATAAEAQRALGAVGLPVAGIAAVAATRKQTRSTFSDTGLGSA